MNRFLSISPMTIALAIASGMGSAWAQGDDTRIELHEAKAALSAIVAKSEAQEAELARLKTVNSNLSKGLLAANAEAEEFRASYQEMRLQLEALGVEAVAGANGVEQKLLKAVNDLRLVEEERAAMSDALIALSEASMRLLEGSVDATPEARASLEKAITGADVALGLPSEHESKAVSAVSLHDARIVSVKKDFGTVVFNVGRETGARVGMPFELRRKDRPVGQAIIVAVREHIAAALVEEINVKGDAPRVGDHASVATTN